MRFRASIVATLVLLMTAWWPSSTAVNPKNPLIVEGEDRSRDAGECAGDGEEMRVAEGADNSGGAALEFPNDGCWAEWDLLDLSLPLIALVIGSAPPTGGFSGVKECVVWEVEILGVVKGSADPHCGENGEGTHEERLVVLSTTQPLTFNLPELTIRVTSQITQGPSYANAYVDYLGLTFGALPVSCQGANAAPTAPGILTNGMSGGRYGWVRHAYTFTGLEATDPDGDPIRYHWRFTDGTVLPGLEVERAMAKLGTGAVWLEAIDDPSYRLPGCANGLTSATPMVFQAVDAWTPRLAKVPTSLSAPALLGGSGCFSVQTDAGPILGGACNLRAFVNTKDAPASLVDRVDFSVDGVAFATDATSPYAVLYDSAAFAAGPHFMTIVAHAVDDVYTEAWPSKPVPYVDL